MYKKKITIDIDRGYANRIPSVQYDNDRKVVIRLVNDGQPVDLTTVRPVLTCRKPDGYEIFNSTKVLDGKKGELEISLTEQINACVGQVACNIKMYGEDGGLVTTQEFYINVGPGISTKEVESSGEYTTLRDTLNTVQGFDNRIKSNAAKIEEVANKGTTVEVVERVTKQEIERQIADGTMANLTLQDKSVTVDKIGEDVIKDGVTHLELDKSNLTSGCLSGDGTVTNSTVNPEKDKTFDFIPVKPNTEYERNPDGSSKVNRQSVCFYDAYKVFIARQTNEIGQYKFTTPPNCHFIRIDCLTQYVDVEYIKTGLAYSLNMELIAEGSVTGDKIENNSISLDKLSSDMLTENATNLFDKNSCEPGYISSNSGFATITVTSRDSTSDYIEVEPQTKYSKNPESSSKFNKQDVAFYDKQKRLLGGFVLEIGEYQFTTPVDCYYLRIDCLTAHLDTEMLVKGEALDRYIPFGASTYSLNPEIIADDSINISKIKDVEELIKTDEISVDEFDLVKAEPSGNNLIVNGLTIACTGAVKKGEDSIIFNNVTGKLPHNGFNELGIFSGHIKGTLKFPKGDRFGKNYVLLANLVEVSPYPGCMVRLLCANPSSFNIDVDEETKYEYYAISLVVCSTQAQILIPREELVIEDDTITASVDFTYYFSKSSGLIRLHDLLHDQIAENKIAGADMVGEEFLTFMCNTAGINPIAYGEFETFTVDGLTTKKVELQHDGDLIEIPNIVIPNTNKKLFNELQTVFENTGKAGYLTSPSGINFKLCVTDDGMLYTAPLSLPKVNIIGTLDGIGADKKVWADLEYQGERVFKRRIKIEWQGNSSLSYPKKNFGITLYDEEGNKAPMSINGWQPESDFHLKANYIDATQARNILNARWAKLINGRTYPNGARGVIDGFPVELYRNGEFYGIYTWNLKQTVGLFQMDKENPKHLMYRAEYQDGAGAFKNWTDSDIKRVWENRIPKGKKEHPELARLIQWVGTADDTEFRTNISQYLDLQSCINYYTMLDIMYLWDNRCKNMTLATWDGSYWYPIFYDLDTSWGLHWNGGSSYPPTSEFPTDSTLWKKISTVFADEVRAKYIELRKGIFTKTNIIREFKAFADSIGADNFAREQAKWTGIPSKNFGIPFIEGWINERFAYLDQKYNVVLED